MIYERGGDILTFQFQGTLSEWVLVNALEFFLLDMLGYSNYYIPDSQKAKAEKHKKKRKKRIGGERRIIVSSLHLGLPAYLFSEALAIVLSLAYFFVYLLNEAIYAFKLGLFYGIVWSSFMLALSLLFTFLLVLAPFLGEARAEEKTKEYYKKEYDVTVKDPREKSPSSD